MNCQETRPLLQPYSDGELDLVRHVQIEQHLAECGACADQAKHLQSLKATLSLKSLYYHAPASLLTRLTSSTSLPTDHDRRFVTRRFSVAVGFLLLVGASVIIGSQLFRPTQSRGDKLIDAIVANHIRSTQVDHLTDVVSSDRHTVKPWFQGKLDFAPEVPDLTDDDFSLTGGRLDYVVDRRVAALVYFCRKHAINVFIWPSASDNDRPVQRVLRNGFHMRHWVRTGLTYWVVSDLNDQELDEFVTKFNPPLGACHLQ